LSKILCIANSLDNFNDIIKKDIDGVIIGINNLSINCSFSLSIDEIVNIFPKLIGKEVFILINKVIYNKDIPYLEEVMLKLNDLNINGVLFYDLAVIEIAREINFKSELIVYQNHLNNSIYSNNFYYDMGCLGSLLSSELTLDEILDIRKKTNIKLFINVYGYVPISFSKRKLITSYFNYVGDKKYDNKYFLKEEDRYYPILEDNLGTYVYDFNIIDLDYEFKILMDNNIDYVILNFNMIDDNVLKTIEKYISIRNGEVVLKNDLYKGFLYKKMIYKVGSNE